MKKIVSAIALLITSLVGSLGCSGEAEVDYEVSELRTGTARTQGTTAALRGRLISESRIDSRTYRVSVGLICYGDYAEVPFTSNLAGGGPTGTVTTTDARDPQRVTVKCSREGTANIKTLEVALTSNRAHETSADLVFALQTGPSFRGFPDSNVLDNRVAIAMKLQ